MASRSSTTRSVRVACLLGAAFLAYVYFHGNPRTKLPSYATASPFLLQLNSQLQEQCFSSSPPTVKDRVVPAYLIAAHDNETIDGLAELLSQLYAPDDVFVVHLDAKVSDAAMEGIMASVPSKCSNIRFVRERISVTWATWSIVEMELQMLREAASMEMHWDMAMFLDGSSWPLTTRAQRQNWLQKLPAGSSSAIGGWPTPICSVGNDGGECKRTPARCIAPNCAKMSGTPNGGRVLWGTQWVRLSRQFVNYLLTDPTALKWIEFFKETVVPDEHFFSSVLYASPHAQEASFDLHLYVDFDHSANCRSYPNTRPGSSPCYLGEGELQDLTVDQPRIFGRKFYAGDAIKDRILGIAAGREEQL